ncbi:signal peptidase I [Cohnella lubricantis]|uniref:Signal peptidase I n=1 Tax=Cohnella lubricantis TaxID=2163172 RepID=A0A841TGC7_9BACL|nr:signal peptidase I [Cohnella lubricantis]MBB6678989.1 signal peptidase I [Cohnella lubricantis]MBP2119524.1 signal peptidase I [Cohnella lubricantis]
MRTQAALGAASDIVQAPQPRQPRWLAEALRFIRALVIAAAIVSLLQSFVCQLSRVKSISMEPTLYERDWLLADKISLAFGHPRRGDIVILKDPDPDSDQKKLLVKRVVGAPGDRIEARGGRLYVNGMPEAEPYTDSVIEDGDMGPVTVTAGYYFVMGDNRHWGASKDSRSFGLVPEKTIKARADLIVWPIKHWNSL